MSRGRKVALGALRFAVGGALLAWVLSREGTLSALSRMFAAPWLLPSIMLLIAGGALLEAYRLMLLFRSQALRLSAADGFRVISIGTFFNFCIPGGTGGDVMKLWYLASGNPGRRVEVLTLLFVDRVVALASVIAVILALAVPSAGLLREHASLAALLAAAAGVLAALAAFAALALSERVRASRLYTGTLNKLPMGGYVRRGMDALYAFRAHGRAFALAFAVSLGGHALLLALVVLTGLVVLPDVPAGPLCFLTLLGMIANVLPVTPGGLGVGEAAIDGLFSLAGYGLGSPVIVAWRLAQLPLLVLGALFYAAGTRRGAELLQAQDGDPAAPEEPR